MNTAWKLKIFAVVLLTIGMYFNGAFAQGNSGGKGDGTANENTSGVINSDVPVLTGNSGGGYLIPPKSVQPDCKR